MITVIAIRLKKTELSHVKKSQHNTHTGTQNFCPIKDNVCGIF